MSTAWSLYVTLLTLGTLIGVTWLLLATRRGQRDSTSDKTVGHRFDGIEEYDNPLPRWWFWLFIGTLLFSVGYLLLYPGLGGWKGLLPGYEHLDRDGKTPFADGQTGWTSAHEWEREVADAQARFGPIYARFEQMPIPEVANDPQALAMGERLFANNCAVCHGADAQGAFGYPNLTDDVWRWGGDPASIKATLMNGRIAVMPPWGQVLGEQGTRDVTAYVLTLGKRPVPANANADPVAGQKLFATMCTACHGAEGKGMAILGAPDLTRPDAFIYGSHFEQIRRTIAEGRQGRMPAQAELQGSARLHVLAAYIYSLSHGEAPAAP